MHDDAGQATRSRTAEDRTAEAIGYGVLGIATGLAPVALLAVLGVLAGWVFGP